jgi:hypothetical protein
MLSSNVVPVVFEWAVAAVSLRERDPVNAALGFLSHLLAAANKVFTTAAAEAAGQQPGVGAEQQAALLQQGIAQHGKRLVRALVQAACDTAPRQLMRQMGGVLYQLLQPSLTGEAGRQWLLTALQAADLPGTWCVWLRVQLCVRLELRPCACSSHPHAVVAAFGGHATRTVMSDVPASYNMHALFEYSLAAPCSAAFRFCPVKV